MYILLIRIQCLYNYCYCPQHVSRKQIPMSLILLLLCGSNDSGSRGNDAAVELSRKGSETEAIGPYPIGVPTQLRKAIPGYWDLGVILGPFPHVN